jgi:hypothetical protein
MKKTRNQYHIENKCQKAEITIKKSKLLDECLIGIGDLFREIKAIRRTKPKFADSMDGVTEDIPLVTSLVTSETFTGIFTTVSMTQKQCLRSQKKSR